MKRTPLTLMLIFALGLGLKTFAQDLTLNLQVLDEEKLQVLFISDLDLQQLGTAEELFSLQIIKNTNRGFPRCHLLLQVWKDQDLLAYSESDSFAIPADPAGTVYETNNVELVNNSFYLHPGDPSTRIHMKESKLGDEIEGLQEKVLSSGKAPFGVYKLSATLFNDVDGSTVDFREVTFLAATNPSYIQLVSPGGNAGSGLAHPVYTEFPIFQWNGNGEEYQVVVFEKKPMLQSLDDVLGSVPNWESEHLSGLSAMYPQGSGAIPLEFGKTYYWMVRMFVHTSSGIERINSEVWEFKLSDPANQGLSQNALSKQDLLSFLQDLLGEKAKVIKDRLTGFDIRSIMLNGQRIDIQELYQKIRDYRDRKVEVYDVVLPSSSY